MTKYILNSAVITSVGTYDYKLLQLTEMLDLFNKETGWISTIGYPETADALSIITGRKIAVNRVQIKMEKGDCAIVFRLTKRLDNPANKGQIGVQEILNNCEIGLLTRVI